MGAFSPPKPKAPRVVAKPPTITDDSVMMQEAQARLRERRGIAASMLTGERGIPSTLGSSSILGG
jgi:hypothetical protein